MQKTGVQSLGQEDPLGKEMASHSSISAWEIPWRKEPAGLQSMRSQESETTQQLNYHHYQSLINKFQFLNSLKASRFYCIFTGSLRENRLSKKNNTNQLVYKTERFTDIENKLRLSKGKGRDKGLTDTHYYIQNR